MADVVVAAQLGGLEDHLQVGVAAGLAHAHDLLLHAGVVAGQERLARDHHVDLVRARGDRVLGVAQLDVQAAPGPTGSRSPPRRSCTPVPASARARDAGERRVHADGRAGRDLGHVRGRADGLRAEVADLARRVGALERREVEHRDGQADALLLGGRLDRALAERGGALLDPDAVDVGKTADHRFSMTRR